MEALEALKGEDYLTPAQVRRILGISYRMLNALVENGDLPPPIRQGLRWVRYRRADVTAYRQRVFGRKGKSA